MFISMRVYPNARRNEVAGVNDEVWQVRVAAPPIRGEANRELIAFLGRVLGVGTSSLSIVKGATSRNKVIAAGGLTQEEVIKRLSSSSSASSR